MSRLGKQTTEIPSGVDVSVADNTLTVKGPKATLTRPVHKDVTVEVTADGVSVTPNSETKLARSLWGTFAAHVKNMVQGVTDGFEKKLEIEGVGYRAEMKGRTLSLNVGFSHPVELEVPEGLEATVEKNVITITGADKDALGQFAANVRKVKKPEPYKGKGIRYQGEYIIRKQGKKAV
ncbi:50S ribosomal protein L6 [bacterium]|nr:50S ribosomal protein L6 [bacterium]|tara:strand:- start:3636 stop:4169 length:534 start_codon:yes stop_codon:yes gene_type:complete